MRVSVTILAVALFIGNALAQSPSRPPVPGAPLVVEYYYKAKWGNADEFLQLFKKNHYPLLKRQMEMGRILSLKMETPMYHMTEGERWDYRVTITFKGDNPPFDEQALIRELYPDQATYKKEEQRRFEILLAHWDLPLNSVDLNKP